MPWPRDASPHEKITHTYYTCAQMVSAAGAAGPMPLRFLSRRLHQETCFDPATTPVGEGARWYARRPSIVRAMLEVCAVSRAVGRRMVHTESRGRDHGTDAHAWLTRVPLLDRSVHPG